MISEIDPSSVVHVSPGIGKCILYRFQDGIPKYIESQMESVMHVNPIIGKCTLFYNIVRSIMLSSPKHPLLFSLQMWHDQGEWVGCR